MIGISQYQKQEAFKKLKMLFQSVHQKAPPGYEDQTANGLTRCIVDYINLKGYQAERINCFGIPVPVGDGTYRMGKTNMHKGTADISATVNGQSVKIEIKVGRDKMSSFQKAYKVEIEKAGGIYYVAQTFPKFLVWFNKKLLV